MRPLVVLALLVLVVTPAIAAPATEDAWLDELETRVIDDVKAGKPLVVQVHVPLCDNSIIACGNAKLGDGDNPDTNLYWWTTPGFGSWFNRKGSGWSRALKLRGDATGTVDVVALEVYRRTLPAPAAWKKRGAPGKLAVVLVVHGWRGKAIDRALSAYAADVSGGPAREIVLADQTKLAAGGAAQLVAWVGHNRLMDVPAYTWPKPGSAVIGNIAIACATAPYMESTMTSSTRVPLLMTRDLLFANAAPLEATVLAFVRGGGYAEMRADAIEAYARVQKRPAKKVAGVFTNPADRRWGKR